ncbi:hypothetical protein ACSBR2_034601 [Camellia fascicularis]
MTRNDSHVIGLDLSSESISGGIGNTSDLFDLQYLQSLNLANNSFNTAAQIPSGLTRLIRLDLSTLYFLGSPRLKLEKPSLRMLVRNLTKLTELYLDGMEISAQGDDWCQTISLSQPNLRVLSLSNCDLSGPLHPSLQMLRTLSVIQLSDNNLSGPNPEFIANFSNLTSLCLRNFQTHIMEFSTDCCSKAGVTCNDCHVIGLDLSSESISSGIGNMSNLFDLQYLQSLNLANNSFNAAQIPSGLGKLVSPRLKLEKPSLRMLVRNLTKLTELYLDGTKISAQGDDWCQTISLSQPNLRVLSLSNCDLSGPLHPSLQMLWSLSVIQLSDNNLSGPIPEFIANFSNLTSLHLRNCQFGTLPEKIIKVPTLQTLDLSDNGLLEGPLSEFPQKTSFHTLLLGYTNFSGKLPNSIGNLEGLSILILGSCNFTGPIPNSLVNLTQLGNLDLSFNMFTGPIPSFPKNLFHIDLSHNDLSGRIPFTHFEGLRNLVDINLRHNSFKGNIPLSLLTLSSLQIIDLPFNQFEGQIAEFPNASSTSLAFLDMSSNKLKGSLTVLDLSSNNFSGIMQLEMIQTLHQLKRLDLAYNGLSIETNGSYSSLPFFPMIYSL